MLQQTPRFPRQPSGDPDLGRVGNLDAELKAFESGAAGVDLSSHGGIWSRALRPRHPIRKGDVIYTSPRSHFLRAEEAIGRRGAILCKHLKSRADMIHSFAYWHLPGDLLAATTTAAGWPCYWPSGVQLELRQTASGSTLAHGNCDKAEKP